MKTCRLLASFLCLGSYALLTGCGGSSGNGGDGGNGGGGGSQAPTVTSISPTSVMAGSGNLTLTLNGSGFLTTTTVQVGGAAEQTSYVSSTQVTATIPASQLASGAQLGVIALNGSSSSGSGSPINLQVTNPSPTITSVSPTTELAGAASPVVAVTGAGFVPTTQVQVNGAARATTFTSSTQLNVTLSAADVAAAGNLSLTAVNAAPGGGTSTAATVTVNNLVPILSGVSPRNFLIGTGPTTVTITGTNFDAASTVMLNGAAVPTTFVSSTQLTISVANQTSAQEFAVAISNPAPGGGTSSTQYFFALAPTAAPVISSVSPTQFVAGSGASTLIVSGSNFMQQVSTSPSTWVITSTVLWNGTPLTTSGYGLLSTSNQELNAQVPASLLATAGSASITVTSTVATPSTSNAVTVPIVNPPPPTLTSISPAGGPLNTATTITLQGTGFTSQSTAALGGTNIQSSYQFPGQMTAVIPASAVALPGIVNLTVTTPAPGGGTSAPLPYTAYVAIPNNSMVYDPVNGLFYLSVPSAAGPPYGNSVVSIDPLTGTLGTPIPVGSEPDQLALSSDGRYLWVSLDGASAIRKVDLQAGTTISEFSVTPQAGLSFAATALATLPGAADSLIVATPAGNTGPALAIYDSGVVRGTPIQATFDTYNPWALAADGSKLEIYAAGSGSIGTQNYNTYTYGASGLTLKASSNTSLSYASQNNNEITILNGALYTDFGQVDDAESGALLGSFYSSGTTLAQGSTAVDSALGRAFVLEGYWGSDALQLQSFNLADFSATTTPTVSLPNPTFRPSYQIEGPTGMRLTRWGSDGLAYRSTGGFVSFRTSAVRDLSTVDADLGVTVTPNAVASTGSTTIYTTSVTNNGPSAASNVALTTLIPSTGVLTSATPSVGSCNIAAAVECSLGSLSSGASTTVIFNVLQTTAGSAIFTAQVSASENDPVTSNNQATSTVSITGSAFYLAPALSAILPNAIVSGSSDTTITLTGKNFNSGSTALLNGTPLSTTFVSSTQLTAIVPKANLASLGWAPVAVSNPAPGGGSSAPLPLSIFSFLTLGVNHVLYDPYSRKIMASVSSGSSAVAGNSIVAVTPDNATIGTPATVSGTPANLALSSDGQILYALIPAGTTGSIVHFNMLTGQPDFTATGFQASGYNVGLRDIAVQPGAENTVAVDQGEYTGISIFDFNTTTQTAIARGAATGIYTGTCLAFPDASDLYSIDLYSSPTALAIWSVTSTGLVSESSYFNNTAILQSMNCYKLSGGFLFTESGGVASTSEVLPTQVGVFEDIPIASDYGTGVKDFEADTSLGLSYFLTESNGDLYSGTFDTVTAFNNQTFMPVSSLSIPFSTIEGTTGFTGVDVVRWGQDGLAILSSGGHIYLVRGAFVVPQELTTNSAASLTSSSAPSLTHGAGNTLLTLTGSNFTPGVAVTWNGSYRTTTIVDASHVTVAIPASDLVNVGSSSLVATNPGAPASNTLTITIN